MTAANDMPRRLAAGSVSQGSLRRIGGGASVAEPSADELDHRLGFDLGYRDGLSRATAEAETAAIEARVAWEAAAQARHEAVLAELVAARDACHAAATAFEDARDEDRSWAAALATEIAYAAVVRLLGARHADKRLMAEYGAQLVAIVGRDATTLRVAPDVLDDVRTCVTTIPVEADASLEPGGCMLEGSRGQWRAGLRERLDLLRDGLLVALDDGTVT